MNSKDVNPKSVHKPRVVQADQKNSETLKNAQIAKKIIEQKGKK